MKNSDEPNTDQAAADTGGSRGRGARTSLLALVLALAVGAAGCSNPLDVENPNNLVASDLNNPQGLESAVNGALSTTTNAVGDMMAPYATATDYVQNIGSRDAWLQLDFGYVAEEDNEFIDGAYPSVNEARYMADKAISLAEGFDEEGTIPDRTDLARAYLYGAVIYTTIADMFDDFVISEPGTSGSPPVGPSNMNSLYQTALDYLSTGLSVAQAEGDASLVTRMHAMRARIHFAMGVWNKLNPADGTPSDPLVSSQEAVDAAETVLGRVGDEWTWDLEYSNATVTNGMGGWISNNYINISEEGDPGIVDLDEGLTNIVEVTFTDPVDTATAAPAVAEKVDDYSTNPTETSITAVSADEMHLIVAEAALAAGDDSIFTAHINAIRSVNGLTAYDPDTHSVTPTEMLRHSRKANLFLQGRRLADMYRFGVQAALWQDAAPTMSSPGTFFPITRTEIRANENLGG